MNVFNSSQRIGDIVALEPMASEVFKKYRIDFCCGGNRPLVEALREQHLDEKEVLQELELVYGKQSHQSGQTDFTAMVSEELIDHIVHTHHRFMWDILPEIGELILKILRVHGQKHGDVLFKLHELFGRLRIELEQHLIKEEGVLFPKLKEVQERPTAELRREIITSMQDTEAEHEGAGEILKEMRKLTNDYQAPPDGCATYKLSFKKLEAMESDLFQHIHLENNILFKRMVKE